MSDRFGSALGRAAAVVVLLAALVPARAEVISDESAAILLWPDIVAVDAHSSTWTGSFPVVDTIVQLSNTSTAPILVHCFYENATPHCSNSGLSCLAVDECCNGSSGCGVCEPGWNEVDFRVRLTPRQPLGWRASLGLQEFPLTGAVGSVGPDGSSNAGSNVPPVSEQMFTGSLKCIALNDDGTPSDRNALKGESTRVYFTPGRVGELVVAKHNAIGLRAIDGAVNEDRELVLGGPEREYEGCAETLIVNHFFDFGENPAVEGQSMVSRLVLVPCTQNLRTQTPGSSVVQYVVYNEFEQRFSTSRTVTCKADYILSTIDTPQPDRSIFSAGVSGTLVGQSRLRPIGSGLVGIATEALSPTVGIWGGSKGLLPDYTGMAIAARGKQAADFNIHQQAERDDADIITLP